MADPQSKASMDPNYERRLRNLKEHAKTQSEDLLKTEQRTYFRPDGWGGDPFAVEEMSVPFDRTQANQSLIQAISNQEAPGTTGDVVVASVMINELAAMERAFRVRHTMRRCRASAHVIGRLQGHGDDNGPLIQLGVEYARGILRQAKKPQ